MELQSRYVFYRSGTVESRIRQLVMKLELVDTIEIAHPFVKGFDKIYHCADPEELSAVARGEVSDVIAKRTQEEIAGKEGSATVYTTSFYIGLEIQPKKVGATGPRRLDISYPTTEFTKMVKMWDSFEEQNMGIVVRHIKSTALPEYLFEGDERQPRGGLKRTKSGKINSKLDSPSKKRRSSVTPSDTQSPQMAHQNVASTPSITPAPIDIPPQILPMYAGLTKSPTGLKTPPSIPFGNGESTVAPTGSV